MQRHWTWVIGAAIAAGALFLTGCPAPAGGSGNVAPGLVAQPAATNAPAPAALAAAPDGRVFYTEKNTGQIRVIRDGLVLDAPFATVPVNFAGDRGLVGIALHPGFAQNGRVYVNYTRSDTGDASNNPDAVIDQRIVYFTAAGDVAAGGEVFVASLAVGAVARVGGLLAFGPDGKLYLGYGDLTDTDAPQDLTSPFGKILRFNDDGSIPADNPNPNSAVYASGLRLPRGIAFDPQSQNGFVVESGPQGLDEINLLERGANYGWPDVAGSAGAAAADFVVTHANYRDPLATSRAGLVGASFNPSTNYGPSGEFRLYTGASGGDVLRWDLTTDRLGIVGSTPAMDNLPAPISDVVFTPAGTLYVTGDSAVVRIVRFTVPQ